MLQQQVPPPPPAAMMPQQAAMNIISFRQILDVPSATDRIKLYNETREKFAAMDTGLNHWIQNLRTQHSEYTNATSQFYGTFEPMTATGEASRTSHVPPRTGSPNLGYGNQMTQVNQVGQVVGAKSKEFLMAAGKAGKGLFSKGRNKLRGTGDKVF
jgi:hypothetical protein